MRSAPSACAWHTWGRSRGLVSGTAATWGAGAAAAPSSTKGSAAQLRAMAQQQQLAVRAAVQRVARAHLVASRSSLAAAECSSSSSSATAWSAQASTWAAAHVPTSNPKDSFRRPLGEAVRATSRSAAAAGGDGDADGDADDADDGDGGGPPAAPPTASITSPANAYVKHCVKLRSSSRYRGETGRVLLVGSGLLSEAVGVTGSLTARVVLVRQDLVPADAVAAGPSGGGSAAGARARAGAEAGSGARAGAGAGRSGSRASTPASGRAAAAAAPKPGAGAGAGLAAAAAAVVSQLVPGLLPLCTATVSEPAMKKVTGLLSVDGIDVVAELDLPPALDLEKPGVQIRRLLALDRIQDPGNLGTLIRTAMALGWDGVFLLHGCADPFGDKAIRASRGAALRFPICRGDVSDLQRATRTHGLHLLAAEPDETLTPSPTKPQSPQGQDPGSTPPSSPKPGSQNPELDGQQAAAPGVCLVLGSEGQGLSVEVLACCTPVAIPMAGERMESLNVGVAGGILMFMLGAGMPQLRRRLAQLVGEE